jgi:hypothetical protein
MHISAIIAHFNSMRHIPVAAEVVDLHDTRAYTGCGKSIPEHMHTSSIVKSVRVLINKAKMLLVGSEQKASTTSQSSCGIMI